ncbi:hypothetical protein BJX61DRAFT_507671 [Aspergillus egyptiacus]|nr:hypothetical protein BJX61DRAFT_507671 [Aspergillus egyptiacus]
MHITSPITIPRAFIFLLMDITVQRLTFFVLALLIIPGCMHHVPCLLTSPSPVQSAHSSSPPAHSSSAI